MCIRDRYKYREIESVLIDSKLDTIVVFDKFLNELEKIIDNKLCDAKNYNHDQKMVK